MEQALRRTMGESDMLKITVLMPVYNSRKHIDEAVNSILMQTYKDFEFLIIDDCSSDGTLEYLMKLEDPRIRLVTHSKNMGLVYSLNEGLNLANGEYIARMDGDDISAPRRF
jgi:glycosyltransferase involved in cell wall biosynthesis